MPIDVTITINGTEQKELELDLLEAVVDTNLHLPAMFSITVTDTIDNDTGKLKYTDADTFQVGAEVKIEVETDEVLDEVREVRETLIIGEITAIEPIFSTGGSATLRIRGYDRSHRLTRGKKTRTYGDANPTGNGITEEQIINTIVQETDQITSKRVDTGDLSNLKYHYVLQYNQTDLEFLWSRARLLGYQVYVEDKTLYFQKADAHRGNESTKPAILRWGNNLKCFEPRLTLMHQVNQAMVKGWDPKTKAAIEGMGKMDTSKTVPEIGLGKKGGDLAKTAFKDPAEEVVVDQPVLTIDQAKAMAEARFAQAESEFIQADGECDGDPRLIAGRVVIIEGVGKNFGGDYYVTQARHVYAKGDYRVTFSVTGRAPNTLSYLLHGDNGHVNGRNRIYGVVTAKVTSLEDPEELGRVQVMFPWLPKYKEADLASNWARIATPMGGAERGFFFLPEVDDEVLVAFEHGDVNYPYIVGMLWNHKDKPPVGTANILADDKKKVNQRILRSRSGHLIILDDTEGEEQIIIQDKTEKNSIVINSKENTMTINVDKDYTVIAAGAISTTSDGTTDVTSKGDMTLKGDQGAAITIQASGDVTVKGVNVTIESTANLDIKATGKLNIQGTTVSIQGSAMAEVKAPIVKIN
ncbi:MAG: VgrG-related protein [Anaerolineae bacterium]